MGLDKRKSVKEAYRIPESKLLGASWSFGSLGFILAMKVFHHKTQKKNFVWTGRLTLFFHLGLALLVILYTRGIISL